MVFLPPPTALHSSLCFGVLPSSGSRPPSLLLSAVQSKNSSPFFFAVAFLDFSIYMSLCENGPRVVPAPRPLLRLHGDQSFLSIRLNSKVRPRAGGSWSPMILFSFLSSSPAPDRFLLTCFSSSTLYFLPALSLVAISTFEVFEEALMLGHGTRYLFVHKSDLLPSLQTRFSP